MATVYPESSGRTGPTPSPSVQHRDNAAIGEMLRRARERRGLTLEQISNQTKISLRHLEALEHGDFSVVPSAFYRRAEIRAYARAVDLDQSLVLAGLDDEDTPAVSRELMADPADAEEPTFSRKHIFIVVGVVVAAAVLGRVIGEREPLPLNRDAQVATTTDSEQRADSAVTQASPDTAIGTSQSTQPEPAPPALVPSVVTAAAPAAPVAPKKSTRDPQSAAAVNAPAVVEPPAVSIPPETAAAVEDSPAATADDGPIATEEPGTSKPVPAGTRLVVTTDPPGGRVTVNGIGWGTAPVTIPYLPAGEKRIRVTKEGYAAEERVIPLVEGRSSVVDIRLHAAP